MAEISFPVVTVRVIIDRQLTKSLLKRDFGLNVELPDNRLCPPVIIH